nr:MAG TPA: hypothetical protein [Caudoviricetes sp.]
MQFLFILSLPFHRKKKFEIFLKKLYNIYRK